MPLIATLIAAPSDAPLSQTTIDEVSDALESNEITWLADEFCCDIPLGRNIDMQTAEARLSTIFRSQAVDFAIQPHANRRKAALIADMDSTMIEQECIDELADEMGLKERVASITAKAMNGEIEFEPAVRERVALLEGLNVSVIDQIIEKRITLASGGKTLIATMKANGSYTALVSGGFSQFTSKIASQLGMDENRANVLASKDGVLSGKVIEPILGSEAKVIALNDIADTKNLTADDFIAVGDGANDVPMLQTAGTGVALHAKPSVAAQANIRIDHNDLTALLYLQGYKKDEFVTP